MKQIKRSFLVLCTLILQISMGYAQSYSAESSASLLGKLTGSGKTSHSQQIQISENQSFELNINVSKLNNGAASISGSIANTPNSSFYLQGNAKNLSGAFILKDQKQAYSLTTDASGNAHIEATDINKLLCIELKEHHEKTSVVKGNNTLSSADVSNLQSWPSAPATLLLDFDGQVVTSIYWNGGVTINAAPSGFSDVLKQQIWEMMSEDYRPFNLNVTTNESVYNAAPINRRMRVIFTPTNTAAPGSGGVAYIGSFTWGNETPCWVFNGGLKGAGEAGSHEAGHTLGLGHDGRISPPETYYQGNGNWAPIMGVGYYVNMVQFSKGEYPSANNAENDLNIIGTTNGFTFRADDYGNVLNGTAANIDPNSDGVVLTNGVITTATDRDVFRFHTIGGPLHLLASPGSTQPDLDIALTLTDVNGIPIQTVNSDANLSAAIDFPSIPAGDYYVYVDGAGRPTVSTTGYSDYGSLGNYILSGTVPPVGGICTGSAANGDYTYEVGKSNGSTVIKFIPSAPIAGCSMALIYYKINNGAIFGTYMEASGSNFIKTFSAPAGSVVTFYFTYRVGNTGIERNSSASPHSFTVGNCEGVINNPPGCTGSAANGDYTYEVLSQSGVSTFKFIPGAPIAGCNMALIYYKINNGGIIGMYMDPSGSNFTKSIAITTGSTVTFYFTYRVGTSGIERNSSNAPHSFVVGNCGTNAPLLAPAASAENTAIQNAEAASSIENVASQNILVYPNPSQGQLNLQFSVPLEGMVTVEITDIFNRVVLREQQNNVSNILELNVSDIDNGLYFLHINNGSSDVVKQITIQK